MPILASGSNVTLTVAAGQVLTVQSDQATFDFENPVGTRVGEYASDMTFGPFTAGGSVKITSVQGPVFYDLASGSARGTTASGLYTGLVASRGGCPSAVLSTNKQLMARSKHVAMDALSSFQLVYANWFSFQPSPLEYNAGSASTFTASIEYPVGTLTPVRFGGSTTGTAADGALLVSDPISLNVPRGAAFYVRTWHANATGVLIYADHGLNNVAGSVPTSGEWVTYAATTADLTQSVANANNLIVGRNFRPAAIIGQTSRPSFYIAGDSRLGQGVTFDQVPNSYGGRGEVERSLVKSYATFNAGCTGELLSNAISANYTKRIQLAQYCSHIICEYGINDINASTSLPTMLANLATFAGLFGGKPFYQTTIPPRSTSTDGWATLVNQATNNAGTDAIRVGFNNAIRSGLAAPVTGCIEVADQVESSRDSGLWKAGGRQIADAAITSGLAVLTSATAAFVAGDVGKVVVVQGAGAAAGVLSAVIVTFTNATTVSLSVAAGTTVSGAAANIGGYTGDGLHGSAAGNSLIENSVAFQNIVTS